MKNWINALGTRTATKGIFSNVNYLLFNASFPSSSSPSCTCTYTESSQKRIKLPRRSFVALPLRSVGDERRNVVVGTVQRTRSCTTLRENFLHLSWQRSFANSKKSILTNYEFFVILRRGAIEVLELFFRAAWNPYYLFVLRRGNRKACQIHE